MNKYLVAVIVAFALALAGYLIFNGILGLQATMEQVNCGSPYGNSPRISEGCSEVGRQWK